MKTYRTIASVSAVFVFLLVCVSASCSIYEIKKNLCTSDMGSKEQIVNEMDAKLTKFCETWELKRSEFTKPPRVQLIEAEKIWVVDYNGKEHFVRFIIDNCGSIESSFGSRVDE